MSGALQLGSQFRTLQSGGVNVAFDSGNVKSVELPRTLFHKGMVLRLSGTVTSTGTGTLTAGERVLNLIKRIELIGDGVKTLFSVSGRDAYYMAAILGSKLPEKVDNFTAAAMTAVAFSATIPLHNEAIRMQMPPDSYLDPRQFEKLELKITWGTIADIITGATTQAVNAGTAIDVQVMQTAEGEDNILFRRLVSFDETIIAATSSNLTINVPRVGLLAGILFRFDVDGVASSAVANYLSLKSDNNFLHVDRIAAETLRQRNIYEFSLDSSTFGAGYPGYYYLDLTEDGMISSALNTFDLNVLQLILDVTKSGTTCLVRTNYVFFEPISVG